MEEKERQDEEENFSETYRERYWLWDIGFKQKRWSVRGAKHELFITKKSTIFLKLFSFFLRDVGRIEWEH